MATGAEQNILLRLEEEANWNSAVAKLNRQLFAAFHINKRMKNLLRL